MASHSNSVMLPSLFISVFALHLRKRRSRKLCDLPKPIQPYNLSPTDYGSNISNVSNFNPSGKSCISRGSIQLVPLRKLKKPGVIGAQSWKGKGTWDKTEERGGTRACKPCRPFKGLASVLRQWEAICKCHVRVCWCTMSFARASWLHGLEERVDVWRSVQKAPACCFVF